MSSGVAENWRSGRHPVDLGSSFVRALRAREGKPPPTRKVPTKDFYNFRYKFKPESVDDSKVGTLEPKPGAKSSFRLEHHSTQQDEKHIFSAVAVEQSAQQWECVVVYDEETGVYTLEVLESSLDILHESRVAVKTTKVSPGIEQHADQQGSHVKENEEGIEQEIFGAIEQTVTETPPPIKSKAQSSKPPKTTGSSKGGKASKAQTQNSKPPAKGKGKGKGAASAVQLALPQFKPTKPINAPSASRKVTPEPSIQPPLTKAKPPLALPTAAPVSLVYEGSSEGSVHHHTDVEDEEEDMEPVNPLDLVEEEEGQEVDEDDFAAELEKYMDEGEEESTVYRVEEPARSAPVPLSLNQYAGGLYDDDSSSSEDSEG